MGTRGTDKKQESDLRVLGSTKERIDAGNTRMMRRTLNGIAQIGIELEATRNSTRHGQTQLCGDWMKTPMMIGTTRNENNDFKE